MMFLLTSSFIMFLGLFYIIGTTDGYSVAVAGIKPTKEIIERDCKDPTFVPSYCPKNSTEVEEEDLPKKDKNIRLECFGLPSDEEDCKKEAKDYYINDLSFLANKNLKSRKVYHGEMEIDCLGLPTDAADCLLEFGNDYADTREKYNQFKKSKKKRYGKKKRYAKRTSKSKKDVYFGEMEIECLGLKSDAKHCRTENGYDYANTGEIDIFDELQKKKKGKKKERRMYKIKYGNNEKNKRGEEKEKEEKKKEEKKKENKRKEGTEIRSAGGDRGMFAAEMEMDCLGLPTDARDCFGKQGKDYSRDRPIDAEKGFPSNENKQKQNIRTIIRTESFGSKFKTNCIGLLGDALHCNDATTNNSEITKIIDERKDAGTRLNNVDKISGEAETECIGAPTDPDYCHDFASGVDYKNEKGNAKAAIVVKDNKLYLQFGSKNKSTKRQNKLLKRKNKGKDFEASNRIIGGHPTNPHEFPWIVRIIGGCAAGACAGSLISPRLVLTSYHCTFHPYDKGNKPCDHSDEKRIAYLGRHHFNTSDLKTCDSLDRDPICDSYYGIPIIDVKYPENQGFSEEDNKSHDFAIVVLRDKAIFSPNIRPICLPKQDQDFGDKIAIAAGWGRTATPDVNKWQSPVLRSVDLRVSKKNYTNENILGTTLEKNSKGEYKDACSGDSGGPLMVSDPTKSFNYTIIGTVMGEGYDCINDVETGSEGSTNGLWNKVSVWVDWIMKEMEEMGEIEDEGCKKVIQKAMSYK